MIPLTVCSPESVGLDRATVQRFVAAERKCRALLDDMARHTEDQVEHEYTRRVDAMAKAIGAGERIERALSREAVRGEFEATRAAIGRAMLELKLTLLPDLERLATTTSRKLTEWADERHEKFASELAAWGLADQALIHPRYGEGKLLLTTAGPRSLDPPKSAHPAVCQARIYAESITGSIKALSAELRAGLDRGITPSTALQQATGEPLSAYSEPSLTESLSASFAALAVGAAALA